MPRPTNRATMSSSIFDNDSRQIEFGTLAEQKDEADYDDRSDADDDMAKGRIKFPQDKLYGRDKELAQLMDLYKSFGDDDDRSSRAVFLGGYSGTGKSALVQELVKRINNNGRTGSRTKIMFVSGKFGEIQVGDPFSAISRALDHFVTELADNLTEVELRPLEKRLAKADLTPTSYNSTVLRETLIPSLASLFQRMQESKSTTSTTNDVDGPASGDMSTTTTTTTSVPELPACSGLCHDFNTIKHVFVHFVKAVAAGTQPLVFFIDDLQWADTASFQLIEGFLKDKTSSMNVLFIGAYRPINNEGVDPEQHELSKLMKVVEQARGCGGNDSNGSTCYVTRMEIFNLSPESIVEFIADSVDRHPNEVGEVAEAIYTKTLGNIFFVKQALEELVRRNALYYDVVFFQWQFGDVSRVELEKFLSDDVVQMVQSKIHALPDSVQKALALAAYTNHSTIELDLLEALLRAESVEMDSQDALQTMLDLAFVEGLILKDENSDTLRSSLRSNASSRSQQKKLYKFAHDRIREAACACVEDAQRDEFLLRISTVLLDMGSQHGKRKDWMLFTAARHRNSLPSDLTEPTEMAQLNLKVGKIAKAKGAFTEALAFLRAGVDCLNRQLCWKDQYDLTLELKTELMETEHALGNEQEALEMADEICQNGKTLAERSRAHYTHLEAANVRSDKNYSQTVEKGLEILEMYGIVLPNSPTAHQIRMEKYRLKMALWGRSLLCLADFPIADATNDVVKTAQMQIAARTHLFAHWAKNKNLTAMMGCRMIREALTNKVITADLPSLILALGGAARQAEKYEKAFRYAHTATKLMERFPEETSLDFLRNKMTLHGSLSALRVPFRETIESFLELNKLLVAKGENDKGLGAGMLAMYAFFNASLPLNALMEPKLLLFEETATNLNLKTFLVVFRLQRQCLYNLVGREMLCSKPPTELNGDAFNEEAVLSMLEGPSKNMTFRDISIVRLMLAVIFDDEAVMTEMLDRLDEYPVYDMPVERQHLRMAYMGFAALIVTRRRNSSNDKNNKKQPINKKHAQWAKTCRKFFEKLAQFGSPNAQPVHACMKALEKNTMEEFNEAIKVCGDLGLFNLAAFMNERCGIMIQEEQQNQTVPESVHVAALHEEYFKCAIWFYHDWGAIGKVTQLQSRHDFLRTAIQDKAPSQLSTVRRQAALLGVPRAVALSSQC